MAHAITLTDGTTTIDLYSIANTFVISDGWAMVTADDPETEVGDVINLLIQAASATAMQTVIRNINRLLDAARRRAETGVGAMVYITVQFDGISETQRTPILAGRLEVPNALNRWGTRKIDATLAVTHPAWWESTTETELQLSAASQAAATGGRTLTNSANSWASIAAAQVGGDLPAPLRLELTNTAGAARVYENLWLALNADHDPANFGYFIEGETATGGSSVADGNCSGGNARDITVNPTGTLTYALSAANMQRTRGAPFVILARLQSLSGAGVSVRPSITAAGVTVWWANEPWVLNRLTPHLSMLGTVPLPPQVWDSASNGAVNLVLTFYAAASRTVRLDYLALLPAQDHRLLTLMGNSVANNDTVVDNGTEGWQGVRSGGAILPVVSARRKPLMARPNTTQCIYLFHHTTTGCLIGDTVSLRAWYRPRRSAV